MRTTTWFTSDTHFGHAKIIEFCNRPFASMEEMDEEMIRRWNAVVAKGDTVYHLGDFSLAKDHKAIPRYLERLNGQVHLIYGNHDAKRLQFLKGFTDVKSYKEIKVGEQKIILCHYAFKVWNKSHYGSWNLHGHSHGSLPRDYQRKQLDVGVDCWAYAPISYEEVAKEMEKHVFTPVDHHRDREA
jgi:calcineurin-like phosphoesterase family protein